VTMAIDNHVNVAPKMGKFAARKPTIFYALYGVEINRNFAVFNYDGH